MSDHTLNPVPPLTELERASLVDSIRQMGILTPAIVSGGPARKGDLVDGFHRTAIAEELGIECPKVERRFDTEGEFLIAQIELNLKRRQLTTGQKILMGMKLEPLERELAHTRMMTGAMSKGNTRDIMGAKLGMGGATYERGKKIIQEGSDLLVTKFLAGEISVNEGIRRLRSEQRREYVAELAQQENPSPPDGKWDVLVCDPPWPTENTPYPTQTIEEIRSLPVPEISSENSVLWLWTVDAMLGEAIELIDHWGFTRRSTRIWDKRSSGPGYWVNLQHEYVFIATKGTPTYQYGMLPSIMKAPKREHSRKPDEFYRQVEETCPGTKIDLYGRESRKGWDVWGNEPTKFDKTEESPAHV